ncbi:type IV toxin-antitoxin system AbiEi family antitoxin domain-containing protein [Gordonia sp. VNQ95]|uniref:type IV toxin-antitoxin system AbiEi family antitoxin domain-containing protein n=2 Tax=Gordonia TaxID=2053 RepID=UPI0032B44ABA
MSLANLELAQDHWRGVFSWTELSRRGFSQAQVARMVRGGDLHLLRRGWYATGYAHPLVVQAVSAGGVCSCVTALDLHGIWVVARGNRAHVRARKAAHNAGGRRFCKQFSGPEPEIYPLDDIPTALRHALRCLDAEGIVAACDSILNQDLLDMADLVATFATAPLDIRDLLELCDGRAQSGTESIVRLRFRAMGLRFDIQVKIVGLGHVDFLIGDRLIVEIDSIEFHDKSPEQREADRLRDEIAHRLGYIPLRMSYNRVMFEWKDAAETITDLVRRREHLKALAGPRELVAEIDAAVDGDPDVDDTPNGDDEGDIGGDEYWDDPDFEGC